MERTMIFQDELGSTWGHVASIFLLFLLTIGCVVEEQHEQENILPEDQTERILPIFYIGDPDAALKLQENSLDVMLLDPNSVHSDLDLGSTHILIIDGVAPVDVEFLKNEILDGNPVIALSNPQYLQKLIEDEIEAGVVTSPVFSANTDAEPDLMETEKQNDSEMVGQTNEPDSTVSNLEQTAFGFYRSFGASIIYYSPETDLVQSALGAYKWAQDAVVEVAKSQQTPRTNPGMGEFKFVHQRSWFSNDAYKDAGRINITTTFYKLAEDGSNTDDWWLIEFKLESVPGRVAYGSKWGTERMYITLDADSGYPGYFLSDKSPSTTANTGAGSTFGVSLSMSGPSVSRSWSYAANGVQLYETGDKSEGTAKWDHHVGWKSSPGQNSYEVRPGAIVRVPHGTTNPYQKWFEYYSITWMKLRGLTPIGGTDLRYGFIIWYPTNYSGYKHLRAKHSNKCLDVEGASTSAGARIMQHTCHSGKNQNWTFDPQHDGTYKIVAEHSKKCMDVSNYSTSNGAKIWQWDCGRDIGSKPANQKWKIINRGNGYYAFKSMQSGKCLDIEKASQQDGANLQQWDCHYGNNQLFRRE